MSPLYEAVAAGLEAVGTGRAKVKTGRQQEVPHRNQGSEVNLLPGVGGSTCCCHSSEVSASDGTLGQGHRAVNPKPVESQKRAVCFVGSEGTCGSGAVMGQDTACCTL